MLTKPQNNLLLFVVNYVILSRIEAQNHWNTSLWWHQNIDFDNKINDLKFVQLFEQRSQLRMRPSIDISLAISNDSIVPLESNANREEVIPKSSVDSIRDTIYEHFTRVRSHWGDRQYYKKVKRDLKENFLRMGLSTASQSFWPKELRKTSIRDKAHNIIGIWPGSKRGTPEDKILILGAHYDTVRSSPGVDDNGSGSAAVLEVAKLITQNNCKLDITLIFVLFDMEEDGLKGSKHFVKEYLIPIEMIKKGAQVVGVIIMDMILEHDMTRNSQSLGIIAVNINYNCFITKNHNLLSDPKRALPEWSTKVKRNGYRGDFAAVWARKGVDTELFDTLDRNWLNKNKYRLSLMAPALPELGANIETNYGGLKKYDTFMRSDHASFWYPTNRYITFPAILITDLGPWRRNMRHSYHKPSDDTRNMSDENLAFVKNTIDSIINTILDISKGKCFKSMPEYQ